MTCCWRPIPVSDNSSWMSSSRHVTPLSWYSDSPSRKSVRVIVTSVNSIGSRRAVLSMVSDTSDRPSADRSGVPAKMTSSMRPPRTVRGPWAPSTQATASTRFDLPEPFGPTTTVTPGSNSSTVLSANDLKPRRVRDLRNTREAILRELRQPSDRTHEDRARRGRFREKSRPSARETPAPRPAPLRPRRRRRRGPAAALDGTTRGPRRRRPEGLRARPRPGRRRGCAPNPRPRRPAPGRGTTPGTTPPAPGRRPRRGAARRRCSSAGRRRVPAAEPISGHRPSDLARLAEERGPPADALADDRLAAAPAGLALAGVHLVVQLVLARLPVEVDVLLVGERGATVLHRFLQRLDHRAIEPSDLLARERVAHAVPSQSGAEEDLVAVDVADAG